ncbi:MAG: hypothetical protein CMB80_11995 [Flammeovirgaceae bacterium]|nr:hypothetical protein [Flammeovirgaceae bacterium]HCX23100.1 hypothetical protein [Cytophagales bacterium]|tara:strand:- start:223 stop:1362 length:1140 start_codon:yes stop_codon:yes gene_type:complete
MIRNVLYIAPLILLISCSYPYPIESIGFEKALIVNGLITGESVNQRIELSMASRLDTLFMTPSRDAEVIVTKNFTESFTFEETGAGIYQSIEPFKGDVGDQFELSISLSSGESFKSEVVTHKAAMPVDSIAAIYTNKNGIGGIEMRAISTRTSNEVKYLRWTYDETYEIKVPFASLFEWLGGDKTKIREPTEQVETCWRTLKADKYFVKDLKSTAIDGRLAVPIHFIPNEAVELRHKASFLVSQYTLDFSGYSFWNTLDRLISENGSLVDVQPGNPVGNIFSEGDHAVIGYFDASDVSEKRVFIEPSDFEGKFITSRFDWDRCVQNTISTRELENFMKNGGSENYVLYRQLDPGGFTYVLKSCGDCRVYGTNTKPEFWQ